MKRYKRLSEANLTGRKIIDTKHAIDRFRDRYNNRYSIGRIRKVVYDSKMRIITVTISRVLCCKNLFGRRVSAIPNSPRSPT